MTWIYILSFIGGVVITFLIVSIVEKYQRIKTKKNTLTIYTNNLDLAERVLTVLRSDTIRMIDDIMIKNVRSVQVMIRVKGEFEKWKGEISNEWDGSSENVSGKSQ